MQRCYYTRSLLIVILLVIGGHNAAHADISFTDEASFLSALAGDFTSHNFDNFSHLTVVSSQFDGVDFQGSARIFDEVTNSSGGSTHTPPNVLLNFGSAPITFIFDAPVDGVGFYNSSIADREQVILFDEDGAELFTGELPEGSVNYIGFISDTPIASGSVVGIAPTNGTIFIDTFSFGMVPEPTTFTILAIGGLSLLRRRVT